jgi:hypothetical protein
MSIIKINALHKQCIVVTLCLVVNSFHTLLGVSIVYNMRIVAPATGRQELYKKLGTTLPSIMAITYLNQSRTVKNGNKQNVKAGLAEYLYSRKNFYIRLDTALGRVHEDIKTGGSTTHTQADDLLFSVGYQHKVKPQLNFTYSFLWGIPLHKDHTFEYFQFGTGHWAVGGQIDSTYSWGDQGTNSLLSALRLLHFYKAQTNIPTPTSTPLCVDFNVGNLFDIFIAYHKRMNKHHLECGYNPSFVFNASTSPALPTPIPSHGVRNNWYATYRYVFVPKHHPMGLLFGISYGFDNVRVIGLKRIVTCWGAYGINF